MILCKLSCHACELPLLPSLASRPQLQATSRALSGRPAHYEVSFEARKRVSKGFKLATAAPLRLPRGQETE